MYSDNVNYFDGNLSFPLTEMDDGEFSVTKTARTLLTTNPTSNTVCQKQPIGVQRNCCFLVNLANLKGRRDIRADDLGVWNHNGVITSYLKVERNSNGDVSEIFKYPRSYKPSGADLDPDMYVMRRIYHANGTAPDFKRMIVEIEGMNSLH